MIDKEQFIGGLFDKYPEYLFEGRIFIEGCVVSSILQQPSLLEEYRLVKEDFVTDDGRFFIGLAKLLRHRGLNEFDPVSIEASIGPDVRDSLTKRGGYQVIEELMNLASKENYDSYIDQLYREEAIISLYDMGFDLQKTVEFNGNKVVLIELLRQFTCQQVKDYFDNKLTKIKTGKDSKVLYKGKLDIDLDYIKKKDNGERAGIPFDIAFPTEDGLEINSFPFISRQIKGLTPGYVHAISGFSSAGKSTWLVTVIMALLYRGAKVLVISNEDDPDKWRDRFLVWILKKYYDTQIVTKGDLIDGGFSENQTAELKKAIQFYYDHHMNENIFFAQVEEADLDLAEQLAREYITDDGVDVVVYDTFKIETKDMRASRSDLALVEGTRRFDRIAKKYDVTCIISVQLAEHMNDRLFLDASCLSNSKQIKEQLENLLMMRSVFEEELDPDSKYYCRPFRNVQDADTGQWIKETVTLDPSMVWRMLFIEKARNGKNSKDNKQAIILKYDGDHAVFTEYCRCRPRHGSIV